MEWVWILDSNLREKDFSVWTRTAILQMENLFGTKPLDLLKEKNDSLNFIIHYANVYRFEINFCDLIVEVQINKFKM